MQLHRCRKWAQLWFRLSRRVKFHCSREFAPNFSPFSAASSDNRHTKPALKQDKNSKTAPPTTWSANLNILFQLGTDKKCFSATQKLPLKINLCSLDVHWDVSDWSPLARLPWGQVSRFWVGWIQLQRLNLPSMRLDLKVILLKTCLFLGWALRTLRLIASSDSIFQFPPLSYKDVTWGGQH